MWVGRASSGSPGGEVVGVRGLDDEVLLALVAASVASGTSSRVDAGAGRVGGDGLVAQVEAEPAGPGAADHPA